MALQYYLPPLTQKRSSEVLFFYAAWGRLTMRALSWDKRLREKLRNVKFNTRVILIHIYHLWYFQLKFAWSFDPLQKSAPLELFSNCLLSHGAKVATSKIVSAINHKLNLNKNQEPFNTDELFLEELERLKKLKKWTLPTNHYCRSQWWSFSHRVNGSI